MMVRQSKAPLIILAIVMIIAGAYCIARPAIADLATAMIVGVLILFSGLVSLFSWFSLRKEGLSNGWQLLNAILSCLVGVALVGSFVAQAAFMAFIVYMLGFWMIVIGITQIAQGITLKRMKNAVNAQLEDVQIVSGRWFLMVLGGILLIIFAIIGMANPMLALAEMTMIIGLCLIIAGISALFTAIAS